MFKAIRIESLTPTLEHEIVSADTRDAVLWHIEHLHCRNRVVWDDERYVLRVLDGYGQILGEEDITAMVRAWCEPAAVYCDACDPDYWGQGDRHAPEACPSRP